MKVVYDNYGNKAVKVQYKDPLTGVTKDANISYDSRGLPIFDDHAKYITKIDTSVSYRRQMSQATKDLRDAINAGKISTESFTPTQLKQIKAGSGQIDGYTWHHNAQSSPNNMQLIPEDVHNAALHIGQGSLSGGK
ncbi:HNH endonuclease [Acinetobacter portensis]|uniref:HNH endonuclease n=1 Tax=Acinetobacter portensis TaxID=1839785 RepID=UPI0030C82CE2